MMNRQNRTLGFIALFIAAILTIILFRAGYLNSDSLLTVDTPQGEEKAESQDLFGDIIGANTTNQPTVAERGAFVNIIGNMLKCLSLKGAPPSGEVSLTVDTILDVVSSELGAPSGVFDRWMHWHMRNAEGKEFRLSLEVSESDEGKILKELHYFSVDSAGQVNAVDLPAEKARNPSDEDIKQLLQSGEVFYKERGAAALFANGDRLEFIEKNNLISEIEFYHGTALFRCQDLRGPDSCRCQ